MLQQACLPSCPPEPPWSRRRAGPRPALGPSFPSFRHRLSPLFSKGRCTEPQRTRFVVSRGAAKTLRPPPHSFVSPCVAGFSTQPSTFDPTESSRPPPTPGLTVGELLT